MAKLEPGVQLCSDCETYYGMLQQPAETPMVDDKQTDRPNRNYIPRRFACVVKISDDDLLFYAAVMKYDKKLSYRKETVRLLHNIEIRLLH